MAWPQGLPNASPVDAAHPEGAAREEERAAERQVQSARGCPKGQRGAATQRTRAGVVAPINAARPEGAAQGGGK
eukprot:2965747-Alexandrium_andersonii.AAC.1